MQRRGWLKASFSVGVTGVMGMTGWPSGVRATVQAIGRWVDEVWVDGARGRDVPVRMRWPDGVQPCPVVLVSHGLGGSRQGGERWSEAWRAAGLLVINLEHPGSNGDVLRQGVEALRRAASAEQLAARVADMRFVLDELTRRAGRAKEAAGAGSGAAWSRVMPGAVGAAGHSFGARTVQALGGQNFGVPGTQAWPDRRFKSLLALSPAMNPSAGLSAQQAFGGMLGPLFCVTGSLDQNPLGAERTGEHRLVVYEGLPRGRRALLWLDGADHMTFAGNLMADGSSAQVNSARVGLFARAEPAVAQAERHTRLIAAATIAWWQQGLQGDGSGLLAFKAGQGLLGSDRFSMD